MNRGGLRGEEGSRQIDLENSSPLLRRDLKRGTPHRDASAVHPAIEAPELGDKCVDRIAQRRRVADVYLESDTAQAPCLDIHVRLAIEESDTGAFGLEPLSDGQADALSGACHTDDLVVESHGAALSCYLMAIGFVGDPTPPVMGREAPQKKNS